MGASVTHGANPKHLKDLQYREHPSLGSMATIANRSPSGFGWNQIVLALIYQVKEFLSSINLKFSSVEYELAFHSMNKQHQSQHQHSLISW